MAWVMDTYSMHVRHTVTAVVTGKPLDLGGSHGRQRSHRPRLMIVCDKALEKLEMKREGCRVIIQGFGNVGSMAATADARGRLQNCRRVRTFMAALYNEKGFDVPKLMDWVHEQHKPLPEFPGGGAKVYCAGSCFSSRATFWFPRRLKIRSPAKNAHRVQRKILCEGANGPTTSPADRHSAREGLFIIPDILANAGGVTVSYFEWVQDRQGFFWRESEVNERLQGRDGAQLR